MKVLALRFSDNYAPEEGTIRLHEELINEYGFVWYGKFGNKIKQSTIDEMMDTEDPKFLMIKCFILSELSTNKLPHFAKLLIFSQNVGDFTLI